MSKRSKIQHKQALAHVSIAQPAIKLIAKSSPLLPLGAMLLAGSMNAMAQQTTADPDKTLKPVVVKEKAEAPEGKDALRATTTTIGKGNQQLRDIPQSVTVVTEKLIDDRNLDTVKEALKNTSGISFLAAEGGEEDIRLRGFSLQATGDVFIDGMRDPAFYERDTFNLDRLEVLRGSASMLFGRGSTGGAVNQVSKQPRTMDENEISITAGSHNYLRATGDFNIQTGENAALRINAMATRADNNGAGSSLDKKGIAATYRFGIGTRDEFSVGLYDLQNNNGMNYGMPWIRPTAASPVSDTTLIDKLDPSAYFGMASDYNGGSAQHVTASHIHRFQDDSELKTSVRKGSYERDQRAGTVRLASGTNLANFSGATVLNRGTHLKIQDMDTLYLQSDYSAKFKALGLQHELLAGADYADEKRQVYAARTAAQGGVNLTKPSTTAGTPDDGASINESARALRQTNQFDSTGYGLYVQDLVQVAPHWKLLAGLRYDNLTGDYSTYAIPNNAAGPVTTTSYSMKVSEVSKRVGVLYQPNELQSYHFSAATSFNTSGEAYSLSANNQDIPPEQSINLELGAKLDSADKRFTTRLALFRSTKLHERNTDPLVNLVTLSGKRHVAGFEVDVAGKLTPQWEIYGSYMWIPEANIDIGVAGSEGQGTRPSLTPEHSGTVWNTYQLTSQWRVGLGVNFRGEQTPIRNPGWTVDSYVTADLMAEYRINDRFTLKGNVSNITNKLYADALYTGHYIPGAGRTVQLTLNAKF
ncbi:TonB-dependent siderophore receptor [Rhodoferax sp.]|uniref:TonB-dependent receptor n=1 Tax=Rhodoferax sp. TaxID=50421 RepID=UPI00271D1CD8|nr:TonB-dependent siderophore receptor [Rhodoferax sp.]MDO9197498.1 TonB-dependent siderophore receptor [Rhodoferax sp.]